MILHSESIPVKFPNRRGHFDFYAPQVPWDSPTIDDDAHFFVFTTKDPKQPILGTITYNVLANMYSTMRPSPIQRCVPFNRRPRARVLEADATDQPAEVDVTNQQDALDVQSCSFSLERDENLPPIPYYLLIVAQKDLPPTHLLDFIVTYVPTQFAERLVYYAPWALGISFAVGVLTCAGWLEWLFVWIQSSLVIVLGSCFVLCCGCGMCVFESFRRPGTDEAVAEEGRVFIPPPVPPHEQTPLVRGRGNFGEAPPSYTPPRGGSTPAAPQRKIPG
ncbi:hypothetical protein BJ742DRAFT_298263 [Cladochytrium replicatum]|nr:hypothetical protein BJ742DRAFT_298263 [Cladochytrium replicatum]